jgi:hypothetical protein
VTAGALTIASVLLTVGPVCGSPMDVDPAGCCKQHGCCAQASATSRVACPMESSRLHSPCGNLKADASSSAAEQCCLRGKLTYPVAHVQPIGSAPALNSAALLTAAQASSVLLPTVFRADVETAHSPPSRPHRIPLFSLNSAFRI